MSAPTSVRAKTLQTRALIISGIWIMWGPCLGLGGVAGYVDPNPRAVPPWTLLTISGVGLVAVIVAWAFVGRAKRAARHLAVQSPTATAASAATPVSAPVSGPPATAPLTPDELYQEPTGLVFLRLDAAKLNVGTQRSGLDARRAVSGLNAGVLPIITMSIVVGIAFFVLVGVGGLLAALDHKELGLAILPWGTCAIVIATVVVGLWRAGIFGTPAKSWAKAHGWAIQQYSNPPEIHGLECHPFTPGIGNGSASTHLWGSWSGRQASSMLYWSGPGAGRAHYQVDLIELPKWLPTLQIVQSGVFDEVAAKVGAQDIQVGHPEFDRTWRVRCDVPEFALALLAGNPILNTLCLADAVGSFSYTIEGGAVVGWSPNPQPGKGLDRRLTTLTAIADAIPARVWETYGRDLPPAAAGA